MSNHVHQLHVGGYGVHCGVPQGPGYGPKSFYGKYDAEGMLALLAHLAESLEDPQPIIERLTADKDRLTVDLAEASRNANSLRSMLETLIESAIAVDNARYIDGNITPNEWGTHIMNVGITRLKLSRM